MAKYIAFLVNNEKVGIKFSKNYKIEETHINKVFINNNCEFIHYKMIKVPVYDTGEILHGKPLKKFDGLLFITSGQKIIAFKTEGFFKDAAKVAKEVDVEVYLK